MPCDKQDCQHKPKRMRAARCKSCARSLALAKPDMRIMSAANMARGRAAKAASMPMRDDYQRLRKTVGAVEARRMIAEHIEARG